MSSYGFLLLVGVLGMLVVATLAIGSVVWQRRWDHDRVSFVLTFPRDVTPAALVSAVRSLIGLGSGAKIPVRSLVFEVSSHARTTQHRLHIPRPWAQTVQSHLLTELPGLTLDPLPDTPLPRFRRGLELKLVGDNAQLRTDTLESGSRRILTALQPVGEHDGLMLQWIVTPLGAGPRPSPLRTRRQSGTWLTTFLTAFWRAPAASSERVSLSTQRAKVAEPQFGAIARVMATSDSPRTTRHLVGRLRAALATVEAPGAHLQPRVMMPSWIARRGQARRTPYQWGESLNAAELAAVIGWPVGGPLLIGLHLRRSRLFAPVSELPRMGRVLGDGQDHGGKRPVAQGLSEAMTHTWLLGKTGAGKSTLVAQMALSDASAASRPAIVVIEPKGDLCADIATRIPEDRRQDVVVLDPSSDVLVGLNPLRLDEPDRELVADEIYGVFQRLSTSWGPRLGDLLYNALQTLACQPDAALTELPLLLGDDGYRRRAVARLGENGWVLRSFWAGYDSLSPADRATIAAPILTRIRPWVTRLRLRQLIGVPRPRWTFRDVLNEGRILLVSLNTGLLGQETVRLLGSLIFQSLWQAAASRAAMPQAERRPVLVYADEWQDYTHLPTDLETMLSQARGYSMGLVLSNQSVTQLSPELRAAVTVHARSKIVMAVGSQDAVHMARELGGGVTPDDLQELGAHEAVASLMVGRETVPPVSFTTRPLSESLIDAAAIRAISRERYGLDPVAVERAIRDRHQPPTAQPPTHRRRRPS